MCASHVYGKHLFTISKTKDKGGNALHLEQDGWHRLLPTDEDHVLRWSPESASLGGAYYQPQLLCP